MAGNVGPIRHTRITRNNTDRLDRVMRRPQATGGSANPATLSRLSATNFSPAAVVEGVISDLVFNTIEDQVGTDISLDTSTGEVTINTDGIYCITSQVVWGGTVPAGSYGYLTIGFFPGTNIDSYIEQVADITARAGSVHQVTAYFPPYFLVAGSIITVSACADYASGTTYTPSFQTVVVQRIV